MLYNIQYSIYIQSDWVNEVLGSDYDSKSLDKLSDEELVVIARSDRRAEALVISRYIKFIWKKSESFANSLIDSDDLAQEGLLGLMSAVAGFNPDKNVKFSAFAAICITNRMKTLVSKSNKVDSPVDNIEELSVLQGISFSETPETIFLYKEYYSDLFDKIDSVLTERENVVFQMYIYDMSYKDIAEKLKITEKSVDNAIQRARRKIKLLMKASEK